MSEYSPFILVIIVVIGLITATKVRERFPWIPDHEFIFSSPCLGFDDAKKIKAGEVSLEYAASFQKGINSSIVCLKEVKFGMPFPNQTYDGMIGTVQRNESNTVVGFFPYDSVPYEPGIFVPSPISVFSPNIYASKIKGESKTDLDILYLYTNFTIESWLYWIYAMMIVSTLCIICTFVIEEGNIPNSILEIFKNYLFHWWNYLMLTMDLAPTTISSIKSVSLQWTITVIAVFYGIHMIFMSILSADLTVNEPDKSINSISDLLNDSTFQHLIPTIVTNLNMVNVLLGSLKYSHERQLLDAANKSNGIITLGSDVSHVGPEIFDLLMDVMMRKRAVIEDSFFLDIIISNAMCHIEPEKSLSITKSSETLYQTPLAMIISHSTHPILVKLFIYRSETGVEFGIVKGLIRHFFNPVLEEAGIKTNIKGYDCIDQFRGISIKDMETPEWNPLKLLFFQRFICICIGIMMISMIILMIEIVRKKFTLARTRKKIRPVSAKVITISRPVKLTLQTVPRVASAPVVRKCIS